MSSSNQPVMFVTQTHFPLPSQKYMIPASWRRYQLSQLINKALSLATHVPFDFLIKGEILRTSLGEWCAENGAGEEETLEIEYIESVQPPQKMTDYPHEDWVSGVLCNLQQRLITASYDGHIRAFDYSKNTLASASVHTAPITALALVPSTQNTDLTHLIATSSHDLTAAITKVTFSAKATAANTQVLATLHLHTAPVSSISSSPSGGHLLTSSWDNLIGLWNASIPSTDEVPELESDVNERTKRRKVEDESKPRRKSPINVLKSHTARVSRAVFGSSQTAYSCGFDSTIRTWDTETGVSTDTIVASEKPFLDLSVAPDSRSVVATSTDRTMTLYDLRSAAERAISPVSASFFHPATPSCVTFGQTGKQVVTGAYDGVVRVWDLRSTKSVMASFKAWDGNKKILDVDWKRGVVGVAGEGGLEVWKLGEEAN